MPDARALQILRGVSPQKVTVAKEVLRLLGELKVPQAFDYLLELGQTDLHRDARVAFLRALWDHLEDPRAWPLLEAGARDNDPAIATMVARTTAPRLSPRARHKLNALLAELLTHSQARVRLQTLQNATLGAISDPELQLLPPLIQSLQSPVRQENESAACALWSTYAAQTNAIREAIRAILPSRRTLQNAIVALEFQIAYSTRHFEGASRATLEVLASDPLALNLRLRLASLALSPAEFAELVEEIEAAGALHAEALLGLCRHFESGSNAPDEALETLRTRWQTADSPALRRLSLALLKGLALSPSGWTPARRETLEILRADPAPLVASAAQFTFWDDGRDEELPEIEAEEEFDFEEF